MDDRAAEHESAYFRRVESRLVALEFKVERNDERIGKLEPIVGELRDDNMLADKLAERMQQTRRQAFTRVSIAAALGAVFVPPVLTALLVKYGFN